MKPPCAYQGGKQRLAPAIVDLLLATGADRFADLCCGSGAVAVELVNRGIRPEAVTMCDIGPWGAFWQAIGRGDYDLAKFRAQITALPTGPEKIQAHVQALSEEPVDERAVYIYPILQAAAFGSKPIWIEAGRWRNCTFRSYWLPRPETSRQSPVNPMMPMPETLYARVAALVNAMRGVDAYHGDTAVVALPPRATVYLDPPYINTTGYGETFSVEPLARHLASAGHRVFVSEARALTNRAVCLAEGAQRKKGGISGTRATANGEWLSEFVA